jgi:ubiquitin carboxyl-terminal hydrolase 14
VTHKGAAADAGHYMAYVKKRAFHPIAHAAPSAGAGAGEGASAGEGSRAAVTIPEQRRGIDEDDEDWYKFDDAKVSVFPADKIPTLEGGGEDSSAYVLLYRAKPLA